MSIAATVEIITNAIFTPRDLRDPLGVWGARLGVTGDATGNSITVDFVVPSARRAEYVYTCYSVNLTALTVTAENGQGIRVRLLTNWPNIDPAAGVQAYSTARFGSMNTDANFTPPIGGMSGTTPAGAMYVQDIDRFLLLYDPRPGVSGDMSIVQIEGGFNTDTATYSFEAYGYYWDRAVMNTPGGLRHPGTD